MEKKLLGYVNVDSGMVAVYDPGHSNSSGYIWDEAKQSRIKFGFPIPFPNGTEGLAVAADAGIGDGKYPVYAIVDDVPGWGERVLRLEVEFIKHGEV